MFNWCFFVSGVPGVGRNELKKMLLSNSPDKFVTTVPRKTHFKICYYRLINNALEIHRQVKTNEIMFRRFGDVMIPFSRNEQYKRVRQNLTLLNSLVFIFIT